MTFQHVHQSSSHIPQNSSNTSQFAPRPFPVQDPNRPLTQKELENQAFHQNKNEATGLQLKEKQGTITPVEQERLGMLQAKMDGYWVQQKEQSKAQPNLLEILIRNARSAEARESAAPIQPKLNLREPSEQDEQEADHEAEQAMKMPAPPEDSKHQPNQIQAQQQQVPQPATQPQSGFSHIDWFSNAPKSRPMTNRIQAKLTIGQPNDHYEQEADRVAEQVMNMATPPPPVQLQDNEEEESSQTLPPAISPLVQRQGNGLPEVPNYQLNPPSLLTPADPAARYRLGDDHRLQINPEIQAAALRYAQQQLSPINLMPNLAQLRLGSTPAIPPVPSPVAGAPAAAPQPLVPAGEGPETAREGNPGDVLRAVMAVPTINAALTQLSTRTEERILHDWQRLQLGEQVGAVSALAVIGAGAIAGILSNPESRQWALSQLNGQVLPVPGLDWLRVEVNTSANAVMVGFHLDVGALLPSFLGFGPGSASGIGGPPQPEEFRPGVQRSPDPTEPPALQPDLETRLNASRSGGSPLPNEVRQFMEPRFGFDFSKVKVHNDADAVQMNQELGAQAFAHGNHIYYGAGKAPANDHLTGHELTHVVQQTGNIQAKALNSTAISHGPSLVPQITVDSHGQIRRGEAGVHHGIETEATGANSGLSDPAAVEEMYAGNWMRDFSQVNVPVIFNALSQIPARVDAPTGDTIGSAGAEDIAVGMIRALAMLEFGPEITNRLITAQNLGVYEPEQHIDNPIGTAAADHLVRDSETGTLRPASRTHPEEDPTGRLRPEEHGGWHRLSSDPNDPLCRLVAVDSDRDLQLGGSALPGLQAENPELYRVSDTGLGNHIYNSIEWAKHNLIQSAQLGATPEGRMHLGSALHVVEDYFAHSNFIEVALNSQIDRALKAQNMGDQPELPPTFIRAVDQGGVGANHVDTLYDARVGKRRAITTGSFGSMDTKVSLAHIVLPRLPQLGDAINQKIDEALALVEAGNAGWSNIEEMLQTDQAGLAVLELVNAFDRHVEAPVYTGVELTYGEFDLPLTDRVLPYPNGIEPIKEYRGIKSAYDSYAQIYTSVQEQIQRVKDFRDVLVWPATPIIGAVNAVITALENLLEMAIEELRQTIKGQLNQLLFSLIEQIVGLDIPEEKRKSIGDAVDWAHHAVEEMEHGTSLESRLSGEEGEHAGLDDTTALRQFGVDAEGNPIVALPPSHSEISKDHPPHDMMPSHDTRWQYQTRQFEFGGRTVTVSMPTLVDDTEHESSEGSLFYELHRQLAVEADRHLINQIDRVWNDMRERTTAEPGTLTATSPSEREAVLSDARRFSAEEAERAGGAGRAFRTGQDLGIEGLPDLLALVDLFISHPEDSTWWRPILNAYVTTHEAEVIEHIRARNHTRAHRDHAH